jgi:hypothetical protein
MTCPRCMKTEVLEEGLYCDDCASTTDAWHTEHLTHAVQVIDGGLYLRCVPCNSTLIQ